METYLKEQLRRIQALAEQMSSLQREAAELSTERAREQARSAVSHGPLADVKDLRTYTSVGERRETRQPRETAADAPARRKARRRR